MKSIPISVDNFKKVIEGNYYYVDKTMVIEDLIKTGASVTLYTRPRRFGKSLLLSTLDCFFNIETKESNKNLFNDLYISESEYFSYFGKYPVIRLDFKELKGSSYETIYNKLKIIISDAYKSKLYIRESIEDLDNLKIYDSIKNREASIEELQNSITFLTKMLENYYKEKVVVLIDEYDTPINEGHANGYYEEVMELFRPILSSSLKGNDSLKMGVLTGVLRVAKESLFSTFNNPKIYDVMSKGYGEYFGFTKNETKELLEYYGLELTDKVSEMYDGYNIDSTKIYNPWSILNYAESGVLKPYWINTGSNKLLKDLLINLNEDEMIKLETLLKNESITFTYREGLNYENIDTYNDFNSILNLLLFSGYLTYDKSIISEISEENIDFFKIPNNEVKKEILSIVQDISFKTDIMRTPEYEEFLKSIVNENKEYMEKFINMSLNTTSYYDEVEAFYHIYMIGLFGGFLNKNYIVKSNREAGLGRFDLMIEKTDRTLGIIIELKVSDEDNMENKAQEGITQMKEKEYYKELILDKVTNIKEIVIVFHGKKAIVR